MSMLEYCKCAASCCSVITSIIPALVFLVLILPSHEFHVLTQTCQNAQYLPQLECVTCNISQLVPFGHLRDTITRLCLLRTLLTIRLILLSSLPLRPWRPVCCSPPPLSNFGHMSLEARWMYALLFWSCASMCRMIPSCS